MKRLSILLMLMLLLFIALPIKAQSEPDLEGDLKDIPKAPVPVDQYGNPIQPQEPSAQEREAARVAAEALKNEQEKRQQEDEQRIADETRQAEEKRRADELLAEEKQFHDRVTWAIYIGLGILAVFVGSRLLKRND